MSSPATERPGSATTRPPKPPYQLPIEFGAEPDSWTARENLHQILERELLGPLGGPEEVIDALPDAAYLVGRIAPMSLEDGPGDPVDASTDEPGSDVGDAVAAGASRGVPMVAVDDSTAGSEEDDVDDDPQKRGLMIPASMGLRFQIPADLDEFVVEASWGTYRPAPNGDDEPTGRRYQRTPMKVAVAIRTARLTPGSTLRIDLQDFDERAQYVVLRIDSHPDPAAYDDPDFDGRLMVEVALCNDRTTPRKIPVDAWLYQTKLGVHAREQAVFLPVRDILVDSRFEQEDELRRIALHYRDRLEFAHGRTCSVTWTQAPGRRRATKVETTWLPTSETPQTTVGPADRSGVELDMTKLATAADSPEQLAAMLAPLSERYGAWLGEVFVAGRTLPAHLHDDIDELISEAREVQRQITEGFAYLTDPAHVEARRCFGFMNQVMAEQRIHSQLAAKRATDRKLTIAAARAQVEAEGPGAHSWRAFQLAFILMQLPALTDPSLAVRSAGKEARAQLLFFPTGGGKTEAYLGLAAYTFAIRRRQGVLSTPDGDLDGGSGVAVLMRYTLRLLTAQQFQRATALVCAAEVERLERPEIWGATPFRIGLWVGSNVTPKTWEDANNEVERSRNTNSARYLSVLQVERCPWCGGPVEGRHVHSDDAERRIRVFCGNDLGGCPFAEGGAAGDGLPVLTVDEEIYRLTPAFLIATVDKFARLAREGQAAALFGYVGARCDRHGYVHKDFRKCGVAVGGKHNAVRGRPAGAYVRPAPRLRPPDLVIQDELHLITGALGTTVGLFESAIDVMCSWTTPSGKSVRPLVVASTATARNAPDQVRALYGRDLTTFPPQVLDAGATWFSEEKAITRDDPGRKYVGVSTTGVRLTTAEIRVSEVLLASGQLLMDRAGAAADPYLTLVAYFNATRELAGMARYLADDVQTALRRGRPWSRLPRRTGTFRGELNTAELTSRVSSRDITSTLELLKTTFDPAFFSADAKRRRLADRDAGKKPSRWPDPPPYDAVLATSMLQVGVDVSRLGLMLMVGQPKNTAEYIQASSRVGRQARWPGLVVSLGNWARPRDLAHFEQFRHYHETFYAQVEALSVTPYSRTSLDRGLDGVLVSAARVLQGHRTDGLSPERNAGRLGQESDAVSELMAALSERLEWAAPDEEAAERARNRLQNRLGQWRDRIGYLEGRPLHYERVREGESAGALMMSAEDRIAGVLGRNQAPFVVPNSMREVQPEINLLVSPIGNRLFQSTVDAPAWGLPADPGDAP